MKGAHWFRNWKWSSNWQFPIVKTSIPSDHHRISSLSGWTPSRSFPRLASSPPPFSLQCFRLTLFIIYIKKDFFLVEHFRFTAKSKGKYREWLLHQFSGFGSFHLAGYPVSCMKPHSHTTSWWFWYSNWYTYIHKVKSLSQILLLAIPWTVAHQAPPSMGFSR